MRKQNKKAQAAHDAKINANIAMAERILATLKARSANDMADWGDVGDQGHYNELLQDISDSLHHEGEYAE